jgi:hypothetical protein
VTSSGFALKFISGKYQGGEFPLPGGQEIVIGRGGELDIVLVEDMVSRKHAKIVTADGKIVIQDLGSTNGTFVNGEKIRKARLKEGDRVLIGTSILKLISAAESSINQDASGEDLNRLLQEAAARQAQQGGGSPTGMSGSLGEVALPDLLQLFSTSRKSGVLSVTNGDDSGRIYLREGRIFYANWNGVEDIDPMKALFRIIAWETGEFRLGPSNDESFMVELEETPDQLIMEAVRQLDELRRIADDLPEPEDSLMVPKPLPVPLSDLSKDELDVLQLAYNNTFFQPVLDMSPFTDLQTATIVKKLLEAGYLMA